MFLLGKGVITSKGGMEGASEPLSQSVEWRHTLRAGARRKLASAKEPGIQVRWWFLRGADDVDRPFTEIVREGVTALDGPYTPVTWAPRRQIFDLTARHRLPAIYWHRGLDGGLMAYGEDEGEVPRRLAGDVAKALGLTIPPSLLARADEVIG